MNDLYDADDLDRCWQAATQAEREKLLPYRKHKHSCRLMSDGTACTCGFFAAIREQNDK
jgi:hypothetical protein